MTKIQELSYINAAAIFQQTVPDYRPFLLEAQRLQLLYREQRRTRNGHQLALNLGV